MDKHELKRLCEAGLTQREIASAQNVSHTTIRYWLNKYDLKTRPTLSKYVWDEDRFRNACVGAISVGQILERMGVSKYSGNYRRAKRIAANLKVQLPDGSRNGVPRLRGGPTKLSAAEIEARFIRRDTPGSNKRFKIWLVSVFDVPEVCDECGQGTIWNNRKLVLQLDHIDGDSLNFCRDNLRLLCPNCHSQQPTSYRHKTEHA